MPRSLFARIAAAPLRVVAGTAQLFEQVAEEVLGDQTGADENMVHRLADTVEKNVDDVLKG